MGLTRKVALPPRGAGIGTPASPATVFTLAVGPSPTFPPYRKADLGEVVSLGTGSGWPSIETRTISRFRPDVLLTVNRIVKFEISAQLGKTLLGRLLIAVSAILLLASTLFAQQSPETGSLRKPTTPSRKWLKDNSKLLLKDDKGAIVMRIALEKKEKTLAIHPEHKFTEKEILSMKGGVSEDGKFAWVDRREATWLLSGNKGSNLFQYYDHGGKLLWEKRTVVGSHLINDGGMLALLEADPAAIEMLEQGNTFSRPSIYDSSGQLVFDLRECRTFSNSIFLTKNERYGGVACSEFEPQYKRFHLLFDLKRKIKKILEEPGVEVHEDGTYATFEEKQEFDPVTKKYGKFVRKIISHGRIE